MKAKETFLVSIVVVMLFAIAAAAQNADSSRPIPKTTPKQTGGNPAKLPPTVSTPALVPKLVFKNAQSMVSGSGKTVTSIVLSIENWTTFPAELFAQTPNLPPDPCGPGWDYPVSKHQERMLLTVYSKDKTQVYACSPYPTSKSLGFIRFYIEKGKPLPPNLLVVLKDRLKGTTYESNLVSTTPLSSPSK